MNKKILGIILAVIGLLEAVYIVGSSIVSQSGGGTAIYWYVIPYAIPGVVLLIAGLWLYFKNK